MWATIITAALESLISVTKPPNPALQGDFQAMSHFCGLQGSILGKQGQLSPAAAPHSGHLVLASEPSPGYQRHHFLQFLVEIHQNTA